MLFFFCDMGCKSTRSLHVTNSGWVMFEKTGARLLDDLPRSYLGELRYDEFSERDNRRWHICGPCYQKLLDERDRSTEREILNRIAVSSENLVLRFLDLKSEVTKVTAEIERQKKLEVLK